MRQIEGLQQFHHRLRPKCIAHLWAVDRDLGNLPLIRRFIPDVLKLARGRPHASEPERSKPSPQPEIRGLTHRGPDKFRHPRRKPLAAIPRHAVSAIRGHQKPRLRHQRNGTPTKPVKFFIPLPDDPQHGHLDPPKLAPHRLLRAERPINKTPRNLAPTHHQACRCIGITHRIAGNHRLRIPFLQKFSPLAAKRLRRPPGILRQSRPPLVRIFQTRMRRYDHRRIPRRVRTRQSMQRQPATHRIPDQHPLRPTCAHIIRLGIQGLAKARQRHRLARQKSPQVDRPRCDRIRRRRRRKFTPITRRTHRPMQTPALDGSRTANLVSLSGALDHAR